MARLLIEVSNEVAIAYQLSEGWRREFAIELFSDAVLHSHRDLSPFDEDDEEVWLDELPDDLFVDPPDSQNPESR